jgi:TetR/AcrR family transcriptional regulator
MIRAPPRRHVAEAHQQPTANPGRKAATQARILRAAIELFSARGYEGASVSAIASRARVSHSAVFWHFGDKATLFQEAFRSLLEPFLRELESGAEEPDSRKRFFEQFLLYERFVSRNRETIETIVRWVMESRALRETLRKPLFDLHDRFVADLRAGLEGLNLGPGVARAMAAGLVALLDGNLLLALLDPDESKRAVREEGLRTIAELIVRHATG